MDGFGREEDMVVGRWGEDGYTEEEDRSERLLCAAMLQLGALWVRKESRVRIRQGHTHLKGGEERLCVDQATRVRCTR